MDIKKIHEMSGTEYVKWDGVIANPEIGDRVMCKNPIWSGEVEDVIGNAVIVRLFKSRIKLVPTNRLNYSHKLSCYVVCDGQ